MTQHRLPMKPKLKQSTLTEITTKASKFNSTKHI